MPHRKPTHDGSDGTAQCVLLLGSIEVPRGGAMQRLPKKSKGLIAYLAMNRGRRIARDHLATLLWGNTAS